MLEVQVNNSTCDNCGLEYSGDYCPICALKCPYCSEILGQEVPDSYIIGNCPHIVCFQDLKNIGVHWIDVEYEEKYKLFCDALSNEDEKKSNHEDLQNSIELDKAHFVQFLVNEKLGMIEHKLYKSNGDCNPVYFYTINK